MERECYFALMRTKELFQMEKPYVDALLEGSAPGMQPIWSRLSIPERARSIIIRMHLQTGYL